MWIAAANQLVVDQECLSLSGWKVSWQGSTAFDTGEKQEVRGGSVDRH